MREEGTGVNSDEIGRRFAALEQRFADEVRRGREAMATIMVLAARFGDPQFVTIKEAAELEKRLYGKGTVRTVRRRIDNGLYTEIKAQGERAGRIAIEQIHEVHRKSYAPAPRPQRTAREAAERKR